MKIKKFDSLLIVALGWIICDSYDTDDFWLTMYRYIPVIACILGSLIRTYIIALNNYKTLEFEKNKNEDIKLKLEKLQDENNELKEKNNRFSYLKDKVEAKIWVRNLRQQVYDLEKWKNEIISYPRIKDEEIEYFKDIIRYNRSYIPGHQLSCLEKICVKIIFLFNETERLKQELVNQTANNIILKDELNKLKEINN